MKKLYTSKEIEEFFQISPITLQRWRKQGLIPFVKLTSKKILYSQDDVEAVYNACRKSGE